MMPNNKGFLVEHSQTEASYARRTKKDTSVLLSGPANRARRRGATNRNLARVSEREDAKRFDHQGTTEIPFASRRRFLSCFERSSVALSVSLRLHDDGPMHPIALQTCLQLRRKHKETTSQRCGFGFASRILKGCQRARISRHGGDQEREASTWAVVRAF